ncbi:MAG: hypothetical protein RSF82_04110 [Angelakisella sp.]
MLQGSLIILAFVLIAALMMAKKIPTLLALPLMAVVICIIAGVPAVGVDADGKAIGWRPVRCAWAQLLWLLSLAHGWVSL